MRDDSSWTFDTIYEGYSEKWIERTEIYSPQANKLVFVKKSKMNDRCYGPEICSPKKTLLYDWECKNNHTHHLYTVKENR